MKELPKMPFFIPASAFVLPTRGARVEETVTEDGICHFKGQIEPAADGQPIRFQLNVPENWNGKLLHYGGGGFDGYLERATGWPVGQSREYAHPWVRGYATVGSDSGHHSEDTWDASFFYEEESARNFAHEHIKKVRDAASYILKECFDRDIERAYFAGGSNGGRAALRAVGCYPEDYDGAIVLYPVLNWVGKAILDALRADLRMSRGEAGCLTNEEFLRAGDVILTHAAEEDREAGFAQSEAFIAAGTLGSTRRVYRRRSEEEIAAAAECCAKAAADSCNETNPAQISETAGDKVFAPSSLYEITEIPNPASPEVEAARKAILAELRAFLTEEKLQTLLNLEIEMEFPMPLQDGYTYVPGYRLLRMAPFISGDRSVNPKTPGQPDANLDRYGYQVICDEICRNSRMMPAWFDVSAYAERMQAESELLDAFNIELPAMLAHHGSRILFVHGYADSYISAENSVHYIETLKEKYGEKLAENLAFYLVPGYAHGFSRGYQMTADLLSMLEDWVERGISPGDLMTKDANSEKRVTIPRRV